MFHGVFVIMGRRPKPADREAGVGGRRSWQFARGEAGDNPQEVLVTRTLCWGLAALTLARTAIAAELSIAAEPPLPVANQVRNPGAENGRDLLPEDWSFTTARPDIYTTGWVDGGRSGKCLWAKCRTSEMSGYWSQSVPVTAGLKHRFSGWYRLASGRLMCYAHGRGTLPDGRTRTIDQRVYQGTMRGHWLAPVFLAPEALGGPDPALWYPFRIEVEVTEGFTSLTFSAGLYFQPGEVWFDDLFAGLARTTLLPVVKAGEGETLRRVVVRQAGVDKPLHDTRELPAGAREWHQRLADLPTDAVYEVEATLTDGRVVRQGYPTTEEARP